MNRILVIGSPGAGKTTFSKKLAVKTGLPLIHLDAMFWQDNWTHVSREEFDKKLETVLERECWIIDGDYTRTLPARLRKCDFVIFLNYSRVVCILSILKRVFRYYGKSRPDMGNNCPERLDIPFLKYVWHYPKKEKQVLLQCLNSAKVPIFIAKNRKEADKFLKNCN
jgi:adenylate kinase family enzyme